MIGLLVLALPACRDDSRKSNTANCELSSYGGEGPPDPCSCESRDEVARIHERHADDKRFISEAHLGKSVPEQEAARAISRGDFRLAAFFRERQRDAAFTTPGAVCFASPTLTAIRGYSYGFDIEMMVTVPNREFARRYNETLLADRSYPFRDICRSEELGKRPAQLAPSQFGFRNLAQTQMPIDLGEAARRGTLESMRRLLAQEPDQINKPDIFEMTPLAWAIAYRREEQARLLISSQAHFGGSACADPRKPTAPIQVARQLRWHAMVDLLLKGVPETDAAHFEDQPRPVASKISAFSAVLRKSVDPLLDKLPEDRFGSYQAELWINKQGRATKCALGPSTEMADLDSLICKTLLEHYPAESGRDRYGEAREGKLLVRLGLFKPESQSTRPGETPK